MSAPVPVHSGDGPYSAHERHLIREARDALSLVLCDKAVLRWLDQPQHNALLYSHATLDRELKR